MGHGRARALLRRLPGAGPRTWSRARSARRTLSLRSPGGALHGGPVPRALPHRVGPADSPTHVALLEQPRRRRFVALVALGLVAAAGVGWALLDGRNGEPHREPAALAGSERVTVEVLNGSGRAGLARTATRVLRLAGF